MSTLDEDRCCATCAHPTEERHYGQIHYNCQLQIDALVPNLALAVYVDPTACCENYRCDEAKVLARCGRGPDSPGDAWASPKASKDYPGSLSGLPLARVWERA